jgi:hypothetical protein
VPADSSYAALRSALYKRGVPQTLYVDNGAIYTSTEINQICGRIGTLLCHTPVRDRAAKGKLERFFRTCRDQFLLRKLDLSSLEALNAQFRDWVENEYNARVHSTLQMKPIDREDFPKNHNLVLVAQPSLMHTLRLGVNEDIRGRITYSVTVPRLHPDDIRAFLFAQLDRIGLGHNSFSEDAIARIVRSSEGILRRCRRNLCVSAIDFLITIRGLSFSQAMRTLCDPPTTS